MITKLLVANRGEIAARVMRTAHALGIATVAVYSDPDADAPFATLADEAVRLPGATPAETYLRGDLVVAAALATGADAVHPGYGFLSENADFARACGEAGLTFVGPTPEVIASMGAKPSAKALMEQAGVPVLPGTTVTDPAELAAAASEIGFPVLVKAAFGGGGRGMRVVHDPAELADAVAGARREAASAFGDGTVFLERFVVDPRHVEVQILGDTHGQVVHLFERECSIQRRYQKILEESPSPAVDDALRAELGAAAVAAGKAIGYTGAGTVEFIVEGSSSGGVSGGGAPRLEFFFLEVNTRLQVEHPVTELVTGLDLVELQLRVAEGEPLPPEVTGARIDGHAIEVRLYAEDVPAGFLPATGTLHRFHVPELPGVRVDSGVVDGSVVGPHYDPMLAKVIAHGRTRRDAARTLARALLRAELHGVTTNRDLLVGILREAEFLAGRTDTGYLTRHDPAALGVATGVPAPQAAAAALARQARHRRDARVLPGLPSGWRNVGGAAQRVAFTHDGQTIEVAYAVRRDGLRLTVGGVPLGETVRLISATPDAVALEIDGVRRRYTVATHDGVSYVDGAEGSAVLVEVPRLTDPAAVAHAGSLLAPMPGTVLRVLAQAGDLVTAGQSLVVLEAMKMEHTVAAPVDGGLAELRVKPGEQVQAGQVLAVLEDAAPEDRVEES